MPPQTHQQTYTITPWRHPSDLLRIRNSLYSPVTPQEQSHAIATVAAWKQRGNVPHAVESTALLMDAMLLHSQFSTSSMTTSSSDSFTTSSSFALRSAYTTALSRFATGFADLGRHRSGPGMSMFEVARSIGLPVHFVELRHEVAHEDLPGLARLVRSSRDAVNWLWGVYWAKLPHESEVGGVSAGVDGEEKDAIREEVSEALRSFRSKRLAALKAAKGRKKENKELVGMLLETQNLCQQLCSGENEAEKWNQLASVLIDDGLIVPSMKQMRGPLSDSVLQGAYMLWDELLQTLASGSPIFVEAFLEKAIAFNAKLTSASNEQDRTDPAKWAMYRWILHVLKSDEWEKMRNESAESFDVLALRECVLHPNRRWSHELAEEILDDADEHMQATWKHIVQASDLSNDQDEEDAAERALEESEQGADVQMEDVRSYHGGWRRETGAWNAMPIGTVA